jgi:hypothetical protein
MVQRATAERPLNQFNYSKHAVWVFMGGQRSVAPHLRNGRPAKLMGSVLKDGNDLAVCDDQQGASQKA